MYPIIKCYLYLAIICDYWVLDYMHIYMYIHTRLELDIVGQLDNWMIYIYIYVCVSRVYVYIYI